MYSLRGVVSVDEVLVHGFGAVEHFAELVAAYGKRNG